MKNTIYNLKKQSDMWLNYGRTAPLLFAVMAFFMYVALNTEIPIIIYSGWAIAITTMVIWWIWVIKAVSQLFELLNALTEKMLEHMECKHKENVDNTK